MEPTGHAIVACARGWLGTRFHHQGRLKKCAAHKGGVDCLGLLVGVAAELGLRELAEADVRDYSHYPDTERLKKRLGEILRPVPVTEIAPGHILLLRVEEHPQHLAIASDIGLIHAYAPARAVVEHAMDERWLAAIEAAYHI